LWPTGQIAIKATGSAKLFLCADGLGCHCVAKPQRQIDGPLRPFGCF
jgi:hypothetical protein